MTNRKRNSKSKFITISRLIQQNSSRKNYCIHKDNFRFCKPSENTSFQLKCNKDLCLVVLVEYLKTIYQKQNNLKRLKYFYNSIYVLDVNFITKKQPSQHSCFFLGPYIFGISWRIDKKFQICRNVTSYHFVTIISKHR